jgi:hypothetical protein
MKSPEKTRAELLAQIASLPPTAFINPKQAAAYLDVTPSVLHCWRAQRRGPRYHGANEFARYRVCDLDDWMSTRANEVIERPENVFSHQRPKLVWPCEPTPERTNQPEFIGGK